MHKGVTFLCFKLVQESVKYVNPIMLTKRRKLEVLEFQFQIEGPQGILWFETHCVPKESIGAVKSNTAKT